MKRRPTAVSHTSVPLRSPKRQAVTTRAAAALALCTIALAPCRPLAAAELLVVDQANCPYCERFEREIAPAWPNTEHGRAAPLRRVDLHAPWPDDLAAVSRPDLTPTFVLVDGGEELGRLAGYPGDEHFWFLIGQLLERLDERAGTPAADGTANTGAASAR